MNDLLKIQSSKKYRICYKVQDDMGSEWSCSLSTTVTAGFHIFSAIVSTDKHNSNPWFCINLGKQLEIYVCTLLMVDFETGKQNTNKFPLISVAHEYLNPLPFTIPFALACCCFERTKDIRLKCVWGIQGSWWSWQQFWMASLSVTFFSNALWKLQHKWGNDTEVIHQYLPETCIYGFTLVIWCVGWRCCLLGNIS